MTNVLDWLGLKLAELTAGGPEGWFYASKVKLKFGTAGSIINALEEASRKIGFKECTSELNYSGSCSLEEAYCDKNGKVAWLLFSCPLGKMLYIEPGYFCVRKCGEAVQRGKRVTIPPGCCSEFRKDIEGGKELVYFICKCSDDEKATEKDLAVILHKVASGWEEVSYASSKALIAGLILSIGVLSVLEAGKAIAKSKRKRR